MILNLFLKNLLQIIPDADCNHEFTSEIEQWYDVRLRMVVWIHGINMQEDGYVKL